MHQHKNNEISLTLPLQESFLPIAQSCVERAGSLFGLNKMKLMRLGLAVEEIFLHFARLSGKEQTVFLQMVPAAVSFDVHFELTSDTLDLKGMNIVSANRAKAMLEEEDYNRLGLLLAASFIDNFSLEQLAGRKYRLSLRQEREYPLVTDTDFTRFAPVPPFHLDRSPGEANLQQVCIQTLALYGDQAYGATFQHPGRFADLVAGGALVALIAEDSNGRICGLLIWELGEDKSIPFHGPYIFTDSHREEVAACLVDGFLGRIARSRAIITYTNQVTDMLPIQQFEPLGVLHYCSPQGDCQVLEACYRHLREDRGETVWAHPDLIPFLEKEYDRLVLVRFIQPTKEYGASRNEASVLGVEMEQLRSLALIKPIIGGQDIAQNIELHLMKLKQQQVNNIFCSIDLGIGWQAAMAGDLLEAGFTAQLIHPLAGKGDCVVFQYATAAP